MLVHVVQQSVVLKCLLYGKVGKECQLLWHVPNARSWYLALRTAWFAAKHLNEAFSLCQSAQNESQECRLAAS